MWPIGPITNVDGTRGGDDHGEEGPPGTSKSDDAAYTQNIDQSIEEVLERISTSLLTDKACIHGPLFIEMDTAQMKDATYTIDEQQEATTTSGDDPGPPHHEALAEKSLSHPAEGSSNKELSTSLKAASILSSKYRTQLSQFSRTANELLECFIPGDYSNPIVGKYYGAVKRILNV
jgi:hypothetical protein